MPNPSGDVPMPKVELSFTSHGEGVFKLKATNISDETITLESFELEAYDKDGRLLEVTEIKSEAGELKQGEESKAFSFTISPAGSEKKIVIDDYTYNIEGKTYSGDIYHERYEAEGGAGWATRNN
ncbi:MAG: hypothetical protein HUJ63_12965 [Enterococcus sp.]|nr:hypothetical protein [Enterococcus sp.]